jgi:hypothetical protein
MTIQFDRNTKVFLSTVATGHNAENTFLVPIEAGYTHSVSKSTVEVEIVEAGGIDGRDILNTALNPVEFSVTINSRMYGTGTEFKPIDFLLWEALFSTTVSEYPNGFTQLKTTSRLTLPTLYVYFVNDLYSYRLDNTAIESADFTLSKASIFKTAWKGQSLRLVRAAGPDAYTDLRAVETFIPNYRTLVHVYDNNDITKKYVMPIMDASLTFSNNMAILTPDNLGTINKPIGNISSAVSISGTINTITRYGGLINGFRSTEDFVFDVLDSDLIRDRYRIELDIGGRITSEPSGRIKIISPFTYVQVPELSTEGAHSLTFAFNSLGEHIEDQNNLFVCFGQTSVESLTLYILNSSGDTIEVTNEVCNDVGVPYAVPNPLS